MMKLEIIEFAGWQNCLHLSNELIEIIITTEIGPRIIHLAFKDCQNLFYQNESLSGQRGGKEWLSYGGHRLWHAPEIPERTYCPDNEPVQFVKHDDYVRLIQPVEITTGIQKEMDIAIHRTKAQVTVTHRLRNCNLWDVELAPWALTVMAAGGIAIMPLPKRGAHAANLKPVNSLVLWKYTDMTDPRWQWGREFVFLKQDKNRSESQKIGIHSPDAWAAYWNCGFLFIKTIAYEPDATYADLGCNIELYTNAEILEVETLGPLSRIAPRQAVEHRETWTLAKDVVLPGSEQELHETLRPFLYPAD